MFRRLLIAAVMLSCVSIAAAARAFDPPSPASSTIPFVVRLVGSNGGAPDAAAGQFTVTVRDLAYNPEPGDWVIVDFSGCADVQMASSPAASGDSLNCTRRWVTSVTNANGVATFTIVGGGNGAPASSTTRCAKIYANGMLLGSVPATAFDLNGSGGVTGADFSMWLGDLGSGTYRARADYSGDGTLSAADLSLWLAALGAGGSATSGALCP